MATLPNPDPLDSLFSFVLPHPQSLTTRNPRPVKPVERERGGRRRAAMATAVGLEAVAAALNSEQTRTRNPLTRNVKRWSSVDGWACDNGDHGVTSWSRTRGRPEEGQQQQQGKREMQKQAAATRKPETLAEFRPDPVSPISPIYGSFSLDWGGWSLTLNY